MPGHVHAEQLPPALSVKRAAHLAGIGRATLYNLVNANQVPHKRIGTRIIIPTRLFLAWLEDDEDDEQENSDGKKTTRQGVGRYLSARGR
jgi:excisionase family DNA binding protein